MARILREVNAANALRSAHYVFAMRRKSGSVWHISDDSVGAKRSLGKYSTRPGMPLPTSVAIFCSSECGAMEYSLSGRSRRYTGRNTILLDLCVLWI